MHNQIKFDPLDIADAENVTEEVARELAKARRDEKAKQLKCELKNTTLRVRKSMLKGQLRKYKSFGVDDGRTRDVFYIHVD